VVGGKYKEATICSKGIIPKFQVD